MEIERKFLIRIPTFLSNHPCFDIVQKYLKPSAGYERRVRKVIDEKNHNIFYFLTLKTKNKELVRKEHEKEISKEEYLSLLEKESAEPQKAIAKKRFKFSYENQLFEIDIFPFSNEYALMEIELTTSDQDVIFPSDVIIIKEVTNDRNFYNSVLATTQSFSY